MNKFTQFTELLSEWLRLREMDSDPELRQSPMLRHQNWERMKQIEEELNRRFPPE